jgi:glycolate oxidase
MQDIIAEGGVAPPRAAARAGIVHMLSSVCAPGLEEVSRAADYPKFFQLYVRGDKEWVDSTIKRALEFGYRAICLTVDRAAYGRRERDLAKGHRPTVRVGHASETFQAAFNWDDVDRVRSYVNVPLILKGISTAEDAEIGVARGVDCITSPTMAGGSSTIRKGRFPRCPRLSPLSAVAPRSLSTAAFCVEPTFSRRWRSVRRR